MSRRMIAPLRIIPGRSIPTQRELGDAGLLSRHPENHIGKCVDEWFSGLDSAQTPSLDGDVQGTPAVKPVGSIIKPDF